MAGLRSALGLNHPRRLACLLVLLSCALCCLSMGGVLRAGGGWWCYGWGCGGRRGRSGVRKELWGEAVDGGKTVGKLVMISAEEE